MNKKQFKKELIILLTILILLVFSIVKTIIPTIFLPYINIKLTGSNLQSLFLELFSIQATIATLSVSIIAIITGNQKADVNGISFMRYISILKPNILKHPVLMIVDLIITGVNYLFVSFELYNLSLFVFILSVTISCLLICDTCLIYKRPADLEEEINEYIMNNYDEDTINDISTSLERNCAKGNTLNTISNLEILTKIIGRELQNENTNLEIIKNIETILSDKFNNFYNCPNNEIPLSILQYINQVYTMFNRATKKIPLMIWDNIFRNLLKFISILGPQKIRRQEKFSLFNLVNNAIYNIYLEDNVRKNSFCAEFFLSWSYFYLKKNNDTSAITNNEDLNYIRESFYNRSLLSLQLSKKAELIITDAQTDQFASLLKIYVELGEIDFLTKNLIKDMRYKFSNKYVAFSLILIVVYSYYIGYKELITNGTPEQTYAIDFLKNISTSLKSSLYSLNLKQFLKEYYNKLLSRMTDWEKFENMVVKTMATDSIVDELLLVFICEKYYYENDMYDCLKIISNNNSSYYIRNICLNDSKFEQTYKDICEKVLNNTKSHGIKRLDILKSALHRLRKEEELENGIRNAISDDSINKFNKMVLNFTQQFVNELCSNFTFNAEETTINEKKIKLCSFNFMDYNDINYLEIDEAICECIKNNIYYFLINVVHKNCIVEKVDYNDKNKQQTLIDLSNGLNCNIIIGNKQTFWDEENQELLNEYVKQFTKLPYPNSDYMIFLLNGNTIFFNMSNISVNIRKVTKDEFENLGVEYKNNKYYYNRISNEEKIEFENEQELLEHLHNIIRNVDITATIKYAFGSDTVGCGIIINFEDD